MAVTKIQNSPEVLKAAAEYNEKTGWVRLYFNTDNGYTWAEDTTDCPKANHSSYDNNPHIAVACEKGNGNDDCGQVSAEDVVAACNNILEN